MFEVSVISLESVEQGGSNVPVTSVPNLNDFAPHEDLGASRYRYTYPQGPHLDALLVNKEADVLVVSFHGALQRKTVTLPRFERLATYSDMPVNSMYFSDPTLWMNETVPLTWFTGWPGSTVPEDVASWIQAAMNATGSTHVILTGGSGGGFASLQVAPLIPGSLAVPFDPQTSVYGYQTLDEKTRWAFHKYYIRAVLPELAKDNFSAVDFQSDWTAPFGPKLSPLLTYSEPVGNHVLYTSNSNDSHHERHHLPFMDAVERGGNQDRVRVHVYDGPKGHVPASGQRMRKVLSEALEWVRQIPPPTA